MSLSDMPLGMMGNPQGGQQDGGSIENVAEVSQQNPSKTIPEDQYFSTGGVTEDDQKAIKDIITDYRSNWMQDRIERFAQWMMNLLYWKGVQVLGWDASSNCWYDAIAWARSQTQDDGEDTELERWINPLVLMFCNVFTATMSRVVPESVVRPENADPQLQDIVTAKASEEALQIIRRKNEIHKLLRSIYEMLFLFGSYFRYTRPVVDGVMFGYDEQAQFEDMEIQTGPHYTCPQCGTETPAASPDGMTCPACGAFMGQESYYAAPRAVGQALAVGVDHLVPLVQIRLLGGPQPEGQARVVHQHVDGGELRRQQGHRGEHGVPVPDIQRDRQGARAKFLGQVIEPVNPAGGGDDADAGGGEPARGGGPEAAARAGDEDGGGLGACHDYSMVVSCAPGTAIWSALRRPEWRRSRPRSAWTPRRPAR